MAILLRDFNVWNLFHNTFTFVGDIHNKIPQKIKLLDGQSRHVIQNKFVTENGWSSYRCGKRILNTGPNPGVDTKLFTIMPLATYCGDPSPFHHLALFSDGCGFVYWCVVAGEREREIIKGPGYYKPVITFPSPLHHPSQ